MEISGASVWALVVVVAINTVFIASLAVALFMINKKVDQALNQAAPVLEKAAETLGKVEETTAHLQERVEHVLDRTTTLVDQISERVDTTTAIAEAAVTEPLISAASLMAGIHRGLRVYTEKASETGETGETSQKGDGR